MISGGAAVRAGKNDVVRQDEGVDHWFALQSSLDRVVLLVTYHRHKSSSIDGAFPGETAYP